MNEETTNEETTNDIDVATTTGNQFMQNSGIQETMRNAMANATKEDVSTESPKDTVKEEESAETSAPETDDQDEDREDVSEPKDAETKTEEASKETAKDDSVQPPEKIPVAISEEVKKIWNELPDEVKKDLTKREKDFANKINQSSEFVKHSQAIRNIEAPYQAMMQSLGADSAQAYQDHLKTAYTLNHGSMQQKVDLIQKTMNVYGIELPSAAKYDDWDFEDTPQADPKIEQLQNQVNQLTNIINGQQQGNQNLQQAEADKVISAFRSDPKHQYFDEVNPLMQGILQSGEAKNLEEAYDMAVMAHPKVRTSILAQKNSESGKKRISEAKNKAAKAKLTAGTNLKSKGGSAVLSDSPKPVKRGQMPDISLTMKKVLASMSED